MKEPFHISGVRFDNAEILTVTIDDGESLGRGEACGVYYKGDTIDVMLASALALVPELEDGLDRAALQDRLPASGARNAIDCALWERDAARAGMAVWQLAGLSAAGPLPTVFTIGIDEPGAMARKAAAMSHARSLKLKLSGDDGDAERLAAVRAARPDCWIGVDANRGFTPESLDALMSDLVGARVSLIEQPFPIGMDQALAGMDRIIPFAADESVQDIDDLEPLVGLVEMINIKLDKCGGLTHALHMERRARELGFKVMVGNMTGTSWSQAPAYVLGQTCDLCDLDGVTFLAHDRSPALRYADGLIHCPDDVWGRGGAA